MLLEGDCEAEGLWLALGEMEGEMEELGLELELGEEEADGE